MAYIRPYPNGYKDFPNKTTPVMGAHLNAMDDALERLDVESARAALRQGPATIFLGDSITQNLNTMTDPLQPLYGESFATLATMKTGQRALFARNAGVTNNTVQDAVARLQSDVIAYRPDRCVILLGTNNTNQAAPTIPETMVAYEEGLILPLLAAGIEPIICTVPPRNGVRTTEPATYRRQSQWNAFLRDVANRYRLRLVDIYAATVDPATGDFKAGYSGDGVHPTKVGYHAMADAFAKAVSPYYPAEGFQAERDRYSPVSLAPNPLFLEGLTGTGNVLPAGWTGSTTDLTVTLENPVEGDGLSAGRWAKFVKTTTASTKNVNWVRTFANMGSAGNPVAVGDRLSWGFRYKISGSTGVGSGAYVTVALRYTDTGGTNVRIVTPMNQFELDGAGTVYFEGTVPAGADRIRFDVSFSTSSLQTFEVGQVTVRNVTGLGLEGLTRTP